MPDRPIVHGVIHNMAAGGRSVRSANLVRVPFGSKQPFAHLILCLDPPCLLLVPLDASVHVGQVLVSQRLSQGFVIASPRCHHLLRIHIIHPPYVVINLPVSDAMGFAGGRGPHSRPVRKVNILIPIPPIGEGRQSRCRRAGRLRGVRSVGRRRSGCRQRSCGAGWRRRRGGRQFRHDWSNRRGLRQSLSTRYQPQHD